MTVKGQLGRSLAVGGALAVLGAGVGMTLTDRAMGVAPPAPAGVTDNAPIVITKVSGESIGPLVGDGPRTSTIEVPLGAGVIRDVDVLTNIEHFAPGDLDIELESPSGRVVKMIVSPPYSAAGNEETAFDNVLWDDSGGTLATNAGSYPGATTLVPEGAFGAFVGEPASGTWILRIRDMEEPSDPPGTPAGGTLVSWQLRLATQNVVPNPLTTTAGQSTEFKQVLNNAPVSTSINVSGAKSYLWDIDVETDIDHTQTDDLEIKLTHVPSGRSTFLSLGSDDGSRNSFASPFFRGRLFDDSAGALVTVGDGQPGSQGDLVPQGALAAFMGIDPNGEWKLEVVDKFANAFEGALNGWSLKIRSTDRAPEPGPGDPGTGTTPPPGGTISATNVCLSPAPRTSRPASGNPGKVQVSVRQLQINQRIFQAAVRRANAIQAWLDAGVVEGDICGGAISKEKLGPGITTGVLAQAQTLTPPRPRPIRPASGQAKRNVKFELTAAQFLINQRVAQAAVRRANALQQRLDSGLTGGDVRDGAITQGKLNAGLAILSAQPSGQPQPATTTVIGRASGGDPSKVKVDAAQLLISQRIGQAAIRRLNALTARLQAGLRTGDFRDGSLSAVDLAQELRK